MVVQSSRISKLLKALDDVFKKALGCGYGEISFDVIVELMYKPTDPSSLGVSRMLFGLLMLVDGAEERGGAEVDLRWGDPHSCHFPLLPLPTLTLPYMTVVYGVMWFGALGIALGYKFRVSTVMFIIPYWYILLMEKSYWNNHSYLFGLLGLLFAGTQAHNYLSIDGYYDESKRGKSVPYWNYFIIKYQLFILYFIAGLKKSDIEWLSGYAMTSLSQHWVFNPFKIVLTTESIDYMIVHWFAFVFDLTVCFWMMYWYTRPVAMMFCASFHLMNSRLFSIGMFPWVCLATMPLFCPPNWPKVLINAAQETFTKCKILCRMEIIPSLKRIPCDLWAKKRLYSSDDTKIASQEDENKIESDVCRKNARVEKTQLIAKTNSRSDSLDGINEEVDKNDKVFKPAELHDKVNNQSVKKKQGIHREKRSWNEKMVVSLLMTYMGLQAFLPYSHFLTKGFNNWTNGLYGYSWDMMVHNWDTILVLVKIVDNESKFEMFLDPEAWTPNQRWTKHGDMMYQYAQCLQKNLNYNLDKKVFTQKYNALSNKDNHELGCSSGMENCEYFEEEVIEKSVDEITSKDISIYIDVWCSLNGRFQQRMFDPNVDLLKVKWSPFRQVDWLMPLLVELNDWRRIMQNIQDHVYSWNNYSDVLFVADYPGLHLENYISPDLSNVSLTVLEGQVFYEPFIKKHKVASRKPGKSRASHLSQGESVRVNTGTFHRVHTVGPNPACYMYTYMNATMKVMSKERRLKEQDAGVNMTPKLPLVKEFQGKLASIFVFLQHVGNAALNILYGVPMLRRVPLR